MLRPADKTSADMFRLDWDKQPLDTYQLLLRDADRQLTRPVS
jgi:hypothetical protein